MPYSFAPVYDSNSRILILGTMPSVKSRAEGFYYANRTNRFWPTLGALYNEAIPDSAELKKEFLLRNGIALWDVCGYCGIDASKDSSIRDVKPNELSVILNAADIKCIFLNGNTAAALYTNFFRGLIYRRFYFRPRARRTLSARTSCRLLSANGKLS